MIHLFPSGHMIHPDTGERVPIYSSATPTSWRGLKTLAYWGSLGEPYTIHADRFIAREALQQENANELEDSAHG